MQIIDKPSEMQDISKRLRRENLLIGFVPTMGALHEGHLSLVRRSKEENDRAVVSIFVNPAQFGPKEDFEKYPQNMKQDSEKLAALGVDFIFAPEPGDIYPNGYSTYINIEGVTGHLCGAFRPGHFRGVATVVAKLFNIVMPHKAYFAQKDFQQTLVIKKMVTDLNMDIDIVVCPTVRESDGLAMSSRNSYLDKEDREAATILYKTLLHAEGMIRSGERNARIIKELMESMLKKEPLVRKIDYAGAYDPDTLEEPAIIKDKALLAIALYIGETRLIDNIVITL